jgi:ribosome-associated translation inhibitor RaiA
MMKGSFMRLHIRSRKLTITRELNELIEERLTRAVNRFEERIQRICVVIVDVNGPKGGVDKALRVSVRLSGGAKVLLTAFGSDLPLMVDKTAARMKLRVSSAIAKVRYFNPRKSIHKEFVR